MSYVRRRPIQSVLFFDKTTKTPKMVGPLDAEKTQEYVDEGVITYRTFVPDDEPTPKQFQFAKVNLKRDTSTPMAMSKRVRFTPLSQPVSRPKAPTPVNMGDETPTRMDTDSPPPEPTPFTIYVSYNGQTLTMDATPFTEMQALKSSILGGEGVDQDDYVVLHPDGAQYGPNATVEEGRSYIIKKVAMGSTIYPTYVPSKSEDQPGGSGQSQPSQDEQDRSESGTGTPPKSATPNFDRFINTLMGHPVWSQKFFVQFWVTGHHWGTSDKSFYTDFPNGKEAVMYTYQMVKAMEFFSNRTGVKLMQGIEKGAATIPEFDDPVTNLIEKHTDSEFTAENIVRQNLLAENVNFIIRGTLVVLPNKEVDVTEPPSKKIYSYLIYVSPSQQTIVAFQVQLWHYSDFLQPSEDKASRKPFDLEGKGLVGLENYKIINYFRDPSLAYVSGTEFIDELRQGLGGQGIKVAARNPSYLDFAQEFEW